MTGTAWRRRAIALTAALATAAPGAWAAASGHGNGNKPAEPNGKTAEPGPAAAGPSGAAGYQEPAPQSSPPGQSKAGGEPAPSALAEGDADAGQSGRSSRKPARLRSVAASATEPAATDTATPPRAQASAASATVEPIAEPAAITPPATVAKPDPRPARTAKSPRRALAPRTAPAGPAAAVAPLAPAPSTVALTAPDASRAATERRADKRPAAKPAAPRTITRTVTRTITRVLELVPPSVWLAIGALAGLGLILALATAVQTVRRRRLEAVRRALVDDVGVLQSALLPVIPAEIGGVAFTAAYRPAEGLAAGGDFFDAFELSGGRTALIVGDVAGHGREVVPLTAAVRYSLRAYLEAGLSPRAVLDVAGNVLAGQLGGRQVTVIVAIHEPDSGHLTYACAGHWPPLILGVPGAAVTACSSPPLGAALPTGRRQTTVAMGPGSAACFFTDGLTDVVVPGGRLGLHGLRAELEKLGPSASAQSVLERVVELSSRQPDDMAACMLLPVAPPVGAGPLRIDELEVDAVAISAGRVERFLRSCGAGEADTVRAVEDARRTSGRCGAAVIAVRTDDRGVAVRVTEPRSATLRLAIRTASSDALAA